LSAAAALFAEPLLADAVERGAIDPAWMFIPLACFAAFLAVYAIDRWVLVRRRSYPPGRAFFQIAFGVLFALLLLPSTFDDWRRRDALAAPVGVEARLLAHSDPAVRAVALEALGFRGPSPARIRQVGRLLEDPATQVRRAAAQVLAQWSGLAPSDRRALAAWAKARAGHEQPGVR
jgi:hypothetical protein